MMMMTSLSPRYVTSPEDCGPPSYVMISLKNIFSFALRTLRLRHVMTVQDQGAMNVEPQMSVQLTLCCHHSTMYVQQYNI